MQLQRSMEGKLFLILNTFEETLALPEATRGTAASEKKWRAYESARSTASSSSRPYHQDRKRSARAGSTRSRWSTHSRGTSCRHGKTWAGATVEGHSLWFVGSRASAWCSLWWRRNCGRSGSSTFRQRFFTRTSRRRCGSRSPRDTKLRMRRRELRWS